MSNKYPDADQSHILMIVSLRALNHFTHCFTRMCTKNHTDTQTKWRNAESEARYIGASLSVLRKLVALSISFIKSVVLVANPKAPSLQSSMS